MRNKAKKKTFLLSLGGSLIVPNGGIDTEFLSRFNKFIRKKVALGHRFFIVVGGGDTARHYIEAAKEVLNDNVKRDDRDWLGIHSTRLNGHLLRTIFKDLAYKHLIKHYDMIDKKVVDYKVVIGVGWKPGWSTDYDTVLLAQDYGFDLLINMSNTDYVYDKDPKKFPDAKPLKKIKWQRIIKLVGKKWTPGLNMPFDPVAAQLAKKTGLKVVICNGQNLKNLEKIMEGKGFEGTMIG